MLVMEWVDGSDLGKIIKQSGGSISEERVLRWMQQVSHGMTAAESQGIIHRDLKPSNIIIDRAGCARVADFGLARVRHSGRTHDDWRRLGNTLLYGP